MATQNTKFKKGQSPWNKGLKITVNNYIGYGMSGKKHSPKTCEKMKLAKLNNPTKYWLGKTRIDIIGEDNSNWKGDNAGYTSKHDWIKRWYGRPNLCDHCGTEDAKKFEWANISGEYKRDRTDWYRLCTRCHRKFDDMDSKMVTTRRIKHGNN